MNREKNGVEKEMITAEDITDITLTQAEYYWEMGYNEFHFTCKIKGKEDILFMREQRHDDGSGFVVHSEKDDIWKRILPTEAYKLDDKLQDVIQYGNYHKRMESLTTIDDCKDLEFELMENDDVHLNRVLGKLWMELEAKVKEIGEGKVLIEEEKNSDIVANFRAETEKQFHKLNGLSAAELEEYVSDYAQRILSENGFLATGASI